MKIRNLYLILLMISAMVFAGCEKSEMQTEELKSNNDFTTTENESFANKSITAENVKLFFTIDNIKVKKEIFELNREKLYILISGEYDSLNNSETVTYDGFTTETGYIEFGKSHNLKLKEQVLFEKHMYEFAEKEGIIAIYEKTGNIPDFYYEYEKSVYDSIFGKKPENKALAVAFHKEFNGQGGTALMFNTCPFMWPGWDNKTSSLLNVGVYGVVTLYDKTFYRKKIGTVWQWGMSYINLIYCDDSTSSAVLWF